MKERYEIRKLLSGAGWVIVDTTWVEQMRGPYRTRKYAEAALERLQA